MKPSKGVRPPPPIFDPIRRDSIKPPVRSVPPPPVTAPVQRPKSHPALTARLRPRGVRLKRRARMVFFRQFATAVGSGVTVAAALHHLAQETSDPRLRAAAGEAQRHVEAGGSLAEFMRKRPECFSRVEAALIAVGEISGALDTVLERIATELENENTLHGRLAVATFLSKYVVLPMLLLVPNFPNIISYGLEALDKAEKAGLRLSESEQQALILREGLKGYGHDLWAQLLPLAVIGMVLYVVWRVVLRTAAGWRAWERVRLLVPPFGSLWRDLAVGRCLSALGLMTNAGVPPATALETCAGISGNGVLDERFEAAARLARADDIPITQALEHTGLISGTALSLIRTGELSGATGDMLSRAAGYYEGDVQSRLKQLPKMVGFYCLIIGAVATLCIVRAAYLLLYDNMFKGVDTFMGVG